MDYRRTLKMLFLRAGVTLGYAVIGGFCLGIGYLAVLVLDDAHVPPAQAIIASPIIPPTQIQQAPPRVTTVLPRALAPSPQSMQAGVYGTSPVSQ